MYMDEEICRDLSWTQSWYFAGLVTGSAAVLWSMLTLIQTIIQRDFRGSWLHAAELAWLIANFFWMYGELYDQRYHSNSSTQILDFYTNISGILMICALTWLCFFYLILTPLGLFLEPNDTKSRGELRCSVLFVTWTQYEGLHVLCWLGKDCAWNHMNIIMWYIFLIPTLLVAVDFVWTSLRKKHSVSEQVHYTATLLWVLGNTIWAMGEFYFPSQDNPLPLWQM
eukprot:gene9176-19010_t